MKSNSNSNSNSNEIVKVNSEISILSLCPNLKVTTLSQKMEQEEANRSESGPRFFPYVFMSNKANTPSEAPQRELFISIWGQKKRQVKAPYVISHVLTRECIRVFDGQKYTDRYLEPIAGYKSASGSKYKVQKAVIDDAIENKGYGCDEAKSLGYKHLFYLVENLDGELNCNMVTMEAFKSEKTYFSRPLSEASSELALGAEVLIQSHKANLGSSKFGDYLKSDLFTQYRVRDLTIEEKRVMARKFEETKETELIAFLED